MLFLYLILCVMYVATHATAEEDKQLFPPKFFVNHIFEKYGNKKILTYEGFEHLLENLGLGGLTFEEGHDVSLHKVNGTFYEIHDEQELHRHSHEGNEIRQRRHIQEVHTSSSSQHGESVVPCLSPQEILESYGLEPTHGLVISQEHFLNICPAIIYELDQKHCWQHPVQKDTIQSIGMTVWLEASISILIMSIAGLLCAAIVPILNGSKGGELLNFLVAVASGTLAGDAVIHLLPQAFQYNPQLESSSVPILRATVTLTSVIIFYIIENILCIIQEKKKRKSKGTLEENNMLNDGKHCHGGSDNTQGALACIVIVGDILHNVTDGLSIGAAFSVNRGTGIACATAVFCHELPHELGDYAILLQEGVSIRRALLWNVFSSVFSFIGMAFGLLLGELLNAAPWINAFTAGSFLYIALANLIPSLKTKSSVGSFLFQIIGLTSGIVLMIFIGLYEHEWERYLTH